ncbi:hypothetical protein BUALT_Bualt10G0035600 [Buddleja alternifolia]|uniref:Uncharacterized protein n=1 Tax=Buddleja alternifolia TaxID=168488 RepID=A0AAV6WX96_9LAMI|nr:hypothetical protein BUALT_Bualt10G0035600 [Buddleja alternifolia]
MNGAKQSVEAVGCKNTSVGERSALEESPRASGGGRSKREIVSLSSPNIGLKIRPKGVVDGQQVNIPVLPLVGPEGRSRLERPYEALLFPGIGFGPFLRSLGGSQEGLLSGGPEPSVRYHSGRACILTLCQDLRAKGHSQVERRLTARPTRRIGTKVRLSGPTVPRGKAFAQWIKFTLGIPTDLPQKLTSTGRFGASMLALRYLGL